MPVTFHSWYRYWEFVYYATNLSGKLYKSRGQAAKIFIDRLKPVFQENSTLYVFHLVEGWCSSGQRALNALSELNQSEYPNLFNYLRKKNKSSKILDLNKQNVKSVHPDISQCWQISGNAPAEDEGNRCIDDSKMWPHYTWHTKPHAKDKSEIRIVDPVKSEKSIAVCCECI